MFTQINIPTFSGGVATQVATKRMQSEVELMENCFLSVETSAEKRGPMHRVAARSTPTAIGTSYLDVPLVDPIGFWENGSGTTKTNFNLDNLYFHFINIDGLNKYCIIINRAGYTFDPIPEKSFTFTIPGTTTVRAISLNSFLTVYRIEPTEWIKEGVDSSSDNGFNRGIFEYLTYGNKRTLDSGTSGYYLSGKLVESNIETSIKNTFGSVDNDIGIILWNKLVPLDFMPDNSARDMGNGLFSGFFGQYTSHEYIHSGDKIQYKTSTSENTITPGKEDIITDPGYWTNVRDNVSFNVNVVSLSLEENGQNLTNFSLIPQYPATVVSSDVGDANGFKANRMLYSLYDNPFVIPMSSASLTPWASDAGYLTSSLPKVIHDEDPALPSGSTIGRGKVWYTRENYIDRPPGFYRTTRWKEHPYIQRIRTEDANSVFDYRRFPIEIFKDSISGLWRVRHMPLEPRLSGTLLSNEGPQCVIKKEKVQAISVWKGRMWLACDHSIISSQSSSYYNFWINDHTQLLENDPMDLEANTGNYNQISHMVSFQEFLLLTTTGSTQMEIRGGDISTGISPSNVSLRASSFFSTAFMSDPQRLGNSLFFATSGAMLMYLGSNVFNSEFAASVDMSLHAKNYLPRRPGLSTVSASTNTMLVTNTEVPNEVFVYNSRLQNEKVVQNSFHKWILSTLDSIVGIKAFEKDVFVCSKRSFGLSSASRKLCVYYHLLGTASAATTPMIDWLTKVPINKIVFDPTSNTTKITLPHFDPQADTIVLPLEWNHIATNQLQAYTKIAVSAVTINAEGYTVMVVNGNWAYQVRNNIPTALPLWAGRTYTFKVELSPLYAKSAATGIINLGVLSLKKMLISHFNTGQYRVEVERYGREKTSVESEPLSIGDSLDKFGNLRIEKLGELVVPLLSFNDKCKITIISDYPTPCNIANIVVFANSRLGSTSVEK